MEPNHLAITGMIAFVERHGYALLFFWVMAEQGAIPLPSTPLLLAAGALARLGRQHLPFSIACCAAGALIADTIWFELGRRRGARVLRFLCRISLEPDSCVHRTEDLFLKYGLKSLLVSKFIPGLNAVAAPLAGNSGAARWQFLAYDSAGAVLWSGTYLLVGYLFREQLDVVLAYASRMGSGLLVVVIALFGLWIGWKFRQRRRFLKQLNISKITAEELRDRLNAGEDLFIVDLRSRMETNPSGIPDAQRISYDDLASGQQQVPRDREVILFCSCPNEASSARAAMLLKSRGITRVRPLLGGVEAWERITVQASQS